MAELALDTQRCRYELHRRKQLVRRNVLQNLQVLKFRLRWFFLSIHRCISQPKSAKEKRPHPAQVHACDTRCSENVSVPIGHSGNGSPCYLQALRLTMFLISGCIGCDSLFTKCLVMTSRSSNSSSTKCVPKPRSVWLVSARNESGKVISMV